MTTAFDVEEVKSSTTTKSVSVILSPTLTSRSGLRGEERETETETERERENDQHNISFVFTFFSSLSFLTGNDFSLNFNNELSSSPSTSSRADASSVSSILLV